MFVCVQLESRRPQAGERFHRQHCLAVGRPDWRLWPEVPLPITHPETAVPPQRHVSDLIASVCTSYIWFAEVQLMIWYTMKSGEFTCNLSCSFLFCNNNTLSFCFRDKVLVCPMKSAPVLLTLSDSKHVVLPVDDDSDLNVVAAFDRRGEYIYTGNAKGKVSHSDTQNLTHSAAFNPTVVLQDSTRQY